MQHTTKTLHNAEASNKHMKTTHTGAITALLPQLIDRVDDAAAKLEEDQAMKIWAF
jgi:hypothetical protein